MFLSSEIQIQNVTGNYIFKYLSVGRFPPLWVFCLEGAIVALRRVLMIQEEQTAHNDEQQRRKKKHNMTSICEAQKI